MKSLQPSTFSVCVFVTDTQGNLLLVQRAKDESGGINTRGLEPICGGVKKKDATLVGAAKREAAEELGIPVNRLRMNSSTHMGTLCCAFFNRATKKLILGTTALLLPNTTTRTSGEITSIAKCKAGLGYLTDTWTGLVTSPQALDRLTTFKLSVQTGVPHLVCFEYQKGSSKGKKSICYRRLAQRTPLDIDWLKEVCPAGFLTHLHPAAYQPDID